jgi:LysR family glycine cleavage system transcriptional activator
VPLPPLQFLQAVEAASRLGSFRAAASELHLTPSAISQQIRAVEDALGARLFERSGRTVVLSGEGQLYCDEVRRALRDLTHAGRRVRARASSRVLRLGTVDALAYEFLIPRLPAFQARFPQLELRIETSMRVVELHASELDAALRVRGSAGPGLTTEPIGPVVATPVCNPALAQAIRTPKDLLRETLIEMHGAGRAAWAKLLRAQGIDVDPQQLRMLSFEGYFETLTAAERGLGVAFGLFPMSSEWATSGRLAIPLGLRVPVEGGVYMVFRNHDPRHALLSEIAAWLREHYAALPVLPNGRVAKRAKTRATTKRPRARSGRVV